MAKPPAGRGLNALLGIAALPDSNASPSMSAASIVHDELDMTTSATPGSSESMSGSLSEESKTFNPRMESEADSIDAAVRSAAASRTPCIDELIGRFIEAASALEQERRSLEAQLERIDKTLSVIKQSRNRVVNEARIVTKRRCR